MDLQLLDALDQIGPYGQGHPEPVFALPDVRVCFAKLGKEEHVRFTLEDARGAAETRATSLEAKLKEMTEKARSAETKAAQNEARAAQAEARAKDALARAEGFPDLGDDELELADPGGAAQQDGVVRGEPLVPDGITSGRASARPVEGEGSDTGAVDACFSHI